MSRFTIADLRRTVELHNRYQCQSGSTYYFREQGRNGYQAVDLYRIDEDGHHSCQRNLETGTAKQCAQAIHAARYEGYIHPQTAKGLTRKQAKAVLEMAGIDFSADFHRLPSEQVDMLVTWAKRTRYSKPERANGSTGRYFFEHLKNRVK